MFTVYYSLYMVIRTHLTEDTNKVYMIYFTCKYSLNSINLNNLRGVFLHCKYWFIPKLVLTPDTATFFRVNTLFGNLKVVESANDDDAQAHLRRYRLA